MKFKLLTIVLMFVFAFSAFAADKPVAKQVLADEKPVPAGKQAEFIKNGLEKEIGVFKGQINKASAPKDVLYTEDFETWPPVNMYLDPESGDGAWLQGDGTDYGPDDVAEGVAAAYFHDYDYSSGTTGAMITHPIDLTGATGAALKFWYWDDSGTDDVEVYASVDSTTWDLIYTTATAVTEWTELSVPLASYVDQSTVWIKFEGYSVYGMTNPHIDLVTVETPPAIPVMELVMGEVAAPPTPIGVTISDTFDFVINSGGADLTISNITMTNPDFGFTPESMVITPGGYLTGVGSFTPSVAGQIEGMMIIEGDDPDNAADTVYFSGIGYPDTYVLEDVQEYPLTQYGWQSINNNADDYTWGWYQNVLYEGNYAFAIRWASPSNDDYLVSPAMPIEAGDFISFESWAHSATYAETWEVLVSTSEPTVENFTIGLDTVTSNSLIPVQYTYDLTQFAGQTIYLAIRNTSANMYYQYVDNILMPAPIYPAIGDIYGTVLNADEEAIEGAWVSLMVADVEHGDSTSATGFYKFDSIPSGTYDVTATADGYDPVTTSAIIEDGQWTMHDYILQFSVVDWCNLQHPFEITIDQGQSTGNIYGQVYEDGLTNPEGQADGIVAELGVGPAGTDPMTDESWVWTAATFNVQSGNNDEYMASAVIDAPGDYNYCYRYALTEGPWVYGDQDGSGNGLQLDQLGVLTVNALTGTQKILITEFVVTPTSGEYVEIYNPNDVEVDLSDYYLTDATHQSSGSFYYNIVTGADFGGGGYTDWHARFPDGAMIPAGEYQTVAIAGDSLFFDEYGVLPTYELFEDGTNFAEDVADMREAAAGSVNNQGGLTNSGEVVILYYWDGMSDLVKDVDYVPYVDTNEGVCKTDSLRDGPDDGEETSAYLADTPLDSQMPADNHGYGYSVHRIDMTEGAQVAEGGNGITGADETSEDLNNTFTDYSVPTPNAPYAAPTFSVAGTVMMTDGTTPFEGVFVNIDEMLDTTDVAGMYEFAGLDSGMYVISFRAAGYLPVDSTIYVFDDLTIDITMEELPPLTEFEEGFEGDFPPAGWSGDFEGTGAWAANSGYYHSGAFSARAGYQAGEFNLVTPRIDLSQVENDMINFFWREYYAAAGNTDSTMFEISTDGDAWTTLGTLYSGPNSPNWELASFDLSAYGDETSVWLRWRYVSDGGANAWWVYIDDIILGADLQFAPEGLTATSQLNVQEVLLEWTHPDVVNKMAAKLARKMSHLSEKERMDLESYLSADANNLSKAIDNFKVYRSEDNVSFTELAADVDSLFYLDATVEYMTEYYYYVAAMYGAEELSSDTVMVMPLGGTVAFSEDFESGVIDPKYTLIDVDGANGYIDDTTFGPLSWLIRATPGFTTHGGDYAIGTGYNQGAVQNDDWFILPAITLGNDGAVFGFYATSQDPGYLETLEVLVSTTDTDPASFTSLLTVDPVPGRPVFGNYNINLAGYENQMVYLAIRCISTDQFVLIVDDIYVIGEGIVNIDDQIAGVPETFALMQNYPNPFNPTTTINFQLPQASDVKIAIYNAMGQKVRTLVTGQMEAGYKNVIWDAKDDHGVNVSTGIYFYKMQAGDFTKSMKMLLLK